MPVAKYNKYCETCRKTFSKSEHFIEDVLNNGQVVLRCKFNVEKNNNKIKKKRCHQCDHKYFPLDHFIEVEFSTGTKVLACKDNFNKNGGRVSKVGKKKRKKYLQYSTHSSEYEKDRHLIRKYKLTLDDYNKLFEQQLGCCAICGKHQIEFSKALAVDHCHNTGKIRGLLCDNCNHSIGSFKEDINYLQSAIFYLSNELLLQSNNVKYVENYNRNYWLVSKYGITLSDYNNILDNQSYCCGICKENKDRFKRNLVVDHDHKTSKVRGLLCPNCNFGLGQLKDNTVLIINAIDYLNKYN